MGTNWDYTPVRLCGLRVAYRLPQEGGGFDTSFYYFHVAGSALRPRNSDLEWDSDGSGGCPYATEGDPRDIFNIHMDIPDGSWIDYLRIYCYREMSVFLPIVARESYFDPAAAGSPVVLVYRF